MNPLQDWPQGEENVASDMMGIREWKGHAGPSAWNAESKSTR